MPVAANLFGSMSRICLALGVEKLDDLAKEIEELTTPPQPRGFMDALKLMPLVSRLTDLMPKTVKDAPCQEVVKPDGGLDELPVLKTWPEDGGPFITLPLVITRDPETGMRNIGTYRMQVYDRRTTGMHWQRHKGGAQHHRVAERLGKRLEVAVALGADPVLTYSATAPMPEGLDELMLAGVLGKRRVELVKCRTIDLEVPANAQIVLEGYVEPGERRREGPVRRSHRPVLAGRRLSGLPPARASRCGSNPVYVTTVVGIPPMEDYYLGKASERIFLPLIRKTLPEIVDMHFPAAGHLPQHRDRLDRQALSGPRAQDHERVLGPRPAHVLEVHRRRRQGRERAGRGGGRVDRRHARRSVARHRDHARVPWTTSTTRRCCRRSAARWASTPRGSGRPRASRASSRSG